MIGITGYGGYISGRLAQILSENGIEFTDVSRNSYLNSYYPKLDVVIHLGAMTNLYECERHPEESFEANVAYTSKIAGFCAEEKIPLIFASSNTANESFGHTRSLYDRQKWIAERIVETVPRYAILRFDTVYGYSPKESKDGRGIINKWIRTAMNDSELTVYRGVSDKLRDYVYVDDVVSAILVALHCPNGLYDVSSGDRRSVLGAANTICAVANSGRVRVIDDPEGIHPIDYRSLDNPNLKWLPNWTPKIDFAHGVAKTIQDYRKASN